MSVQPVLTQLRAFIKLLPLNSAFQATLSIIKMPNAFAHGIT